ncbi:MAG: cellulase family glycosylhydrolase [Planctomycetia bacterium]|nr:cellulase family glycosylhydrolase [Planctomycetia bacterium]
MMKKMIVLFSVIFVLFAGFIQAAEVKVFPPITFEDKDLAPLFPFNIKNGFPDNITNIHTWNPEYALPAGAAGLVKIDHNHFSNQKGTLRFLGTNFCFSASFPEKKDAPAVAQSLARFGINLVRLHHMDARNIWGKNLKKSTTVIDPEQLDRLDFLISEFKKNGIYVNINLHVSRTFNDKDGFPGWETLPRMSKGIDNLDRRMIELQKKYAKDLLTHVNPYTKNAYVNEPAVAVIEINNENSIIASWKSGTMDEMADPYAGEFQKAWNTWLQKKYPSADALVQAWTLGVPFQSLGKDIIGNGNFLSDQSDKKSKLPKKWDVQKDKISKAEFKIVSAKGVPFTDSNILHLNIEKMGKVGWIPQIYRTNLSLKKDMVYTFSFWVRSDRLKEIRTSAGMNHEPWGMLGLAASLPVSDQWTKHEFAFRAKEDDSNARIAFSGFAPGVIELADVSLKEGANFTLPDKNTLLNGKVLCPKRKNPAALYRLFPKALDDWAEFMVQIENDYFQEMYHYVKDDLKAQPPITGTQFHYGARYAQARLDYSDIHSYWNHPHFPNRPWDHNDWYLGSRSLTDFMGSRSTITSLAMSRSIDRAYTVSEYDHPYPNQYCAEGYPMLASLAAFQDWGGLMQFAWSHTSDPEQNALPGFFDMRTSSVKRLHLPACFAMFVRKDIQAGPGKFMYAPELDSAGDLSEIAASFKNISAPFERDKSLAMAVYTGLALKDLEHRTSFSDKIKKINSWADLPGSMGSKEKGWVRNEFKELFWSFPEEDQSGYFTVDTNLTKFFTGFIKGRSFKFKGIELSIGKTRLDWATISLVRSQSGMKAEKSDRLQKGSWLLAANGFVSNSDQVLTSPRKDMITSARAYGGKKGTSPALAEGVPFQLILSKINPESVSVFALDEEGNHKAEVKTQKDKNGTKIEFGPEYKTLWYEILIK